MHTSWIKSLSIVMVLLTSACTPGPLALSVSSGASQTGVLVENYPYAISAIPLHIDQGLIFSTQALTLNYLRRKLQHWAVLQQGEAMRREIEFARVKHPELMVEVIQQHPELYALAAAFDEVAHYRSNPDFDTYMQTLATAAQSSNSENDFVTVSESPFAVFGQHQAVNDNGNTVVVWTEVVPVDNGFPGGPSPQVFAQRYDTHLNPVGPRIAVSETVVQAFGVLPRVAIDQAGNFVVTWIHTVFDPESTSSSVYLRRYQADGTPLGNAELVSNNGDGTAPVIAMDPLTGNFDIVWMSGVAAGDGTPRQIYLRRYLENQPVGSSILQINTVSTSRFTSGYPVAISRNHLGQVVVAWLGSDQPESEDTDIFARRVDGSGLLEGAAETLLNTATEGEQNNPRVALHDNGNFVASWWDAGEGGVVQRFNSAIQPQGLPISSPFDGQGQPHGLGMRSNGQFVVGWFQMMESNNYAVQTYLADGTPLGAPSSLASEFNGEPSMSLNSLGLGLATWFDSQNGVLKSLYAKSFEVSD